MNDNTSNDGVLSQDEALQIEAELDRELLELEQRFEPPSAPPSTSPGSPSSPSSSDSDLENLSLLLTLENEPKSRLLRCGGSCDDAADGRVSPETPPLSSLPGFELFHSSSLEVASACGAISSSIREATLLSNAHDTVKDTPEPTGTGRSGAEDGRGGEKENLPVTDLHHQNKCSTSFHDGPSPQSSTPPSSPMNSTLSESEVEELAIGIAARSVMEYCISQCALEAGNVLRRDREALLKWMGQSGGGRGGGGDFVMEGDLVIEQETKNRSPHPSRHTSSAEPRDDPAAKSYVESATVKNTAEETLYGMLDNYARDAETDARESRKKQELDRSLAREQRRARLRAENKRQSILLKAVGFIQSQARGLIRRKRARLEFSKKRRVSAQQQGLRRCFLLVNYHFLRLGFLQWRMLVAEMSDRGQRKILNETKLLELRGKAAERVQGLCRAWLSYRMLCTMRLQTVATHTAALQVQCLLRSHISRRRLHQKRLQEARVEAILVIQCLFRTHLSCKLLHKAKRGRLEREQTENRSALIIQRQVRSWSFCQETLRRTFLHAQNVRRHSVVQIQSCWRSRLSRKIMLDEQVGCRRLQDSQREMQLARSLAAERFRRDGLRKRQDLERRELRELERRIALEAFHRRKETERCIADATERSVKERERAAKCVDEVLFGESREEPGQSITACDVRFERVKRWHSSISILRARHEEKLRAAESRTYSSPTLRSAPSRSCLRLEIDDHSARRGIDKEMLETVHVGSPSTLETIDLSVEGIEDASGLVMLGFTSLLSLSLNVNKISPDLRCFSGLTRLARLSLRDNCISSLNGVQELAALEDLNVEVNLIHSLSPLGSLDTSCFLPHLKSLKVGSNRIASLPCCFGGEMSIPSIQSLSLCQNRISQVPPNLLRGLEALVTLDLGGNRIHDAHILGTALSAAPSLRCVTISHNRLQSLPSPLSLPLLDELWLSGNAISETKCWADEDRVWLPCLSDLHLQDNCIHVLDPTSFILASPNLRAFDISFNEINRIESMCKLIRHLSFLDTLNISDNPVASEPALTELLMRSNPNINTINGVSVPPDAQWASQAAICASCSATALPAISAVVSYGENIPINRECNGAIESLRDRWHRPLICQACRYTMRSSVSDISQRAGLSFQCPLCSKYILPAPPEPLPLQWNKIFCEAKKSDRGRRRCEYYPSMERYLSLSRKYAEDARCVRKIYRKVRGSSTSVMPGGLGGDTTKVTAVQENLEWISLTKRHFECVLSSAHSPEWTYSVCNNVTEPRFLDQNTRGQLLVKTESSAALQLQILARKYLSRRRVATVRERQRASVLIQKMLRRYLVRKRVKVFKNKSFVYVDEELDSLFHDQNAIEFETGTLDEGLPSFSTWTLKRQSNSNADFIGTCSTEPEKSQLCILDRHSDGNSCSTACGHSPGRVENDEQNESYDPVMHGPNETIDSHPDKVAAGSADHRQKGLQHTFSHEKELMTEWGFSDPRVVQTMLKRKKRMDKARKKKLRAKKMADPTQRLNVFMKKIRLDPSTQY